MFLMLYANFFTKYIMQKEKVEGGGIRAKGHFISGQTDKRGERTDPSYEKGLGRRNRFKSYFF